jgi:hypothetical protein
MRAADSRDGAGETQPRLSVLRRQQGPPHQEPDQPHQEDRLPTDRERGQDAGGAHGMSQQRQGVGRPQRAGQEADGEQRPVGSADPDIRAPDVARPLRAHGDEAGTGRTHVAGGPPSEM